MVCEYCPYEDVSFVQDIIRNILCELYECIVGWTFKIQLLFWFTVIYAHRVRSNNFIEILVRQLIFVNTTAKYYDYMRVEIFFFF